MRQFLSLLIVFISTAIWSQSSQQRYLDGKSAYQKGKYDLSGETFASLVNDPMFGSYATFYLGLCLHKNGDNQKALDAWRQLLIKYPTFSQNEEVHFWMTWVFLERGDFDRGLMQAQFINEDETRSLLYKHWLGDQPFQLLQQLQIKFKDDSVLARTTIKRSLVSDLSETDLEFVTKLKTKFGIESEVITTHDDVRKGEYSIAVLLPFLFDDFDNADQVMNNSLVMDLYQGMLLASSMLEEGNIQMNLFPYDTKRDVAQTKSVLRTQSFEKVDVIIGPLFPKPIQLVNDFSQAHKLNVINPVSSNGRVVGDNPYAFQMKPNYKTMARKAAEFVAGNSTKREAMIYFENKGIEKIIALEYQKAIEELGFNVTNFQPIDGKSARAVLARFSDQEESVLNITDEEALELLEEGRLIRDRQKFDASGNLIAKEDGTPELEYYEMNFTFDTDSLDHIFASTRSNLLANNFVGAIESISDTVRLIGLGEWLDFEMLDYRQLERLKVNLINSQYADRSSDFFIDVEERCITEYRTKLSIYHMLGFESVWWAGQMMHRYGKYFQNGFYNESDFPSLFYGHAYGEGVRDNQIVPIVQFSDRKLKAVNLTHESDKE